MTKDEAKAYFAKLATDAGLPQEQAAAVAAALGNEKFADQVATGFMLNDDYSRNKNAVAEEKRKAEADYAQKHKELEVWAGKYDATIKAAQQLSPELDKYRMTYGPLEGVTTQPANGNGGANSMTPEQVQKLLDDRMGQYAAAFGGTLKNSLKASNDHFTRFGKALDVEKFDQYLAEQRKQNPSMDIEAAYGSFIQPQLDAQRTAEIDAIKKTAYEEGRKDAMSKANIPTDNGQKGYAPVWDPARHELGKLSNEQIEEKAQAEFFAGWNEAAQGATQNR